ncbi:MAG TPA: tetratricopeptide repeat protein [Sedimentisphaerales bacterium]|nr:tetratricopeptide repeat protein [Sedimentisphaerales bacterium]
MSILLEILGRAITVDTADLIWHWLEATAPAADKAVEQISQSQRLANVLELIRAQKTQAAEEHLRLYLFDNPSCIRGRLAAAAFCLSLNHLDKAIEQLNSVYMRNPSNTMALYALGHCYERTGRECEAIEFYQDCLKFKNYLELPRQRLAAIYFKNGQLEKTIQEYELLRSEYPDDIATLLTLGHLYIANSAHGGAIETFNTAILIHPDNFASEGDDDELIHDGNLHEALNRVDELLQSEADRPDLGLRRAELLGAMGAEDEAICQYQDLLRQRPDFLEATIKLGTLYLQTNQQDLAAQQLNRAVEINDQIVDAYIGLATAQNLAGLTSDAFTTLSLAAAIQPNSSLLFVETAMLQFRAGIAEAMIPANAAEEPEDVIKAVIQAHHSQIVRHPINPDLHYRFGLLMMGVGEMQQAIEAFGRALEINPTFGRARSKLAVCLFETDSKEAAMEQLTGPNCLDKQMLELHYQTALLYCDKIKFASSLMNLERQMHQNFTNSGDAAVNISLVLQNLGLLDRAETMWDNLSDTAREAIDMNPPYLPPTL